MTTRSLFRPLLFLTICAAPAFAQPQATQPAEDEPNAVRLHEGGQSEYKSLDALGLSPQQKTDVDAKIDARTATLKAWVASDRGKQLIALREQLAAARREKKADQIAPLRQQIEPLAAEYFEVRTATRLAILGVLEPQQLDRYVGQSLRTRVTSGFEKIELTGEQSTEIDRITVEAASAYLKENPIAKDAYFRQIETTRPALRKRIVETVLTEDQRAALKRPTTRPTTRPAE